MRRNKEERAEKERQWQAENDRPNATCEGVFYVWNKGIKEDCPCKDTCSKYMSHKESSKNYTLYDLPKVRFYYVDAFRKCKFRKEKEK